MRNFSLSKDHNIRRLLIDQDSQKGHAGVQDMQDMQRHRKYRTEKWFQISN